MRRSSVVLKKYLGKFHQLEAFYRPLRSEAALRTCPAVNPAIMDALARSIGWPDLEVPWMAVVGSPIIGELPKTGIFREAEADQSISMEDFLRDADEWHQEPSISRSPATSPCFLPLRSRISLGITGGENKIKDKKEGYLL